MITREAPFVHVCGPTNGATSRHPCAIASVPYLITDCVDKVYIAEEKPGWQASSNPRPPSSISLPSMTIKFVCNGSDFTLTVPI